MNFKKPKDQVISDAYIAAINVIHSQTNYIKNNPGNVGPQLMISTLEMAMGDAIRAAVTSLVNSTYTDEEFETDIGLKS